MVIKTLILKNFGKFHQKTVELDDGFNLIYGANEAGKTTIHRFIEGMFYGFYKSNIKNKRHSDDYETYLPWTNSQDYAGVLILEDQGMRVRIERNFMKNHDDVRIFNDITGEDITSTYDYDSVVKLYDPAKRHLGIQQNVYRNTVSLEQMASKTGDELIMEMKERMANFAETSTFDVSLRKAFEMIKEKKGAIGTSRSKKLPVGMVSDQIEALEKEKEAAILVYDKLKALQLQVLEQQGTIGTLEHEKAAIHDAMDRFKDQAYEKTYQEAKRISDHILELENQITSYAVFETVSNEAIQTAMDHLSQIQMLEHEMAMFEERIEEYHQTILHHQREMEALEDNTIEIGYSEKLIRDVYKFEEFESQKKHIEARISELDGEDQEDTFIKAEKKGRFYKHLTLLFGTLFVLGLLVKVTEYLYPLFTPVAFIEGIHGGLVTLSMGTLLLTLVSLILMLGCFFVKSHWDQSTIALSKVVKKADADLDIAKARLIDLNDKQQNILDKHGCKDVIGLQMLKDQKSQEELYYAENHKRTAQLDDDVALIGSKIESEQVKIENRRVQIAELKHLVNEVAARLQVNDLGELREAMHRQYTYKSMAQEIKNQKILYQQLIQDTPLEHVQELPIMKSLALKEAFKDKGAFAIMERYDALEAQYEQVNDDWMHHHQIKSDLEAQIAYEEANVRKPADIQDAIEAAQSDLNALVNRKDVLDLVEDVLTTLAETRSYEVVPILNRYAAEIISVATDYRYTDIRIDTDMNIRVVEERVNKMVSAEALSAGTMDLMYFALRIGLAMWIQDQTTLPLLLDDAFVQYDDHRMIKMLEYLGTLDRQIILFTCHHREKEVLEKMHVPVVIYNIS